MERGNNRRIIMVIVFIVLIVGLDLAMDKLIKKQESNGELPPPEEKAGFNINIIKMVNASSENENYLISPYNIEVALNLLRDGADGNTKEELDKVIGNRTINDVTVKDKVSVANAVFIKNKYKNDIKTSYTNELKTKYNAEMLYDDFKTPTVINNWVKEKTNEMIDKILDDISPNFVLGLASALAIDVKWEKPFDCFNTKSAEFTKVDNSKMNVEMMNNTYKYNGAKYIKNDEVEGIILPYKKEENSDVELEFVGLLPKDNVNNYVNNLTEEKINNLFTNTKEASSKLHINLSLPRFTYDYEVSNLSEILQNMGIKDAFEEDKANFTKIIEIDKNVYVSTAIHKTKIELNEEGTKAAAVTFFGLEAAGMVPTDFEEINIDFNKPFVYMIREKNTGEILFFGTVYEPNTWEGRTCGDLNG